MRAFLPTYLPLIICRVLCACCWLHAFFHVFVKAQAFHIHLEDGGSSAGGWTWLQILNQSAHQETRKKRAHKPWGTSQGSRALGARFLPDISNRSTMTTERNTTERFRYSDSVKHRLIQRRRQHRQRQTRFSSNEAETHTTPGNSHFSWLCVFLRLQFVTVSPCGEFVLCAFPSAPSQQTTHCTMKCKFAQLKRHPCSACDKAFSVNQAKGQSGSSVRNPNLTQGVAEVFRQSRIFCYTAIFLR